MLLEFALRDFNIVFLCVYHYTLAYEATIFSPWSYLSPIRVFYELKRGGEVLKGVCDVPHTVMMSARQAIEEVI